MIAYWLSFGDEGTGTQECRHTVEILGISALSTFVWESIFDGNLTRVDDTWLRGEMMMPPWKLVFKTGPAISNGMVSVEQSCVILILNGRTRPKAEDALRWISRISELKLEYIAVILLGSEDCDNGWLTRRLRINGGMLDDIFVIYDSLEIDDEHVFRWPLGTATPIHGLVFLYKWNPGSKTSGSVVSDSRLESIYFAKQVIQNACATQALLSILLNVPNLELGTALTEFKEFSASLDPAMRGLALSNCENIRKTHNSFARQSIFEMDSKQAGKDDDVFHFVSYIPFGGRLYELDGLQEGPIDHGAIEPSENWWNSAREIIQKRIKEFEGDEIHFNLMAVIEDKCSRFSKEITELREKLKVRSPRHCLNVIIHGDEHFYFQNSEEMQESERSEIMSRIAQVEQQLQTENDKRRRWQVENIRRKHNYVPFIVELLKLLGKQGMLMPLYMKAKERVRQKSNSSLWFLAPS
ncbi:unnamed protein product [Notodromas monacha]|uniref:Ubiquitin carboxyl-terminal hydrolase n=1 Tax=Notodromas monacha TaxID=399045 RepID=A0A7R9BR22_9CRUS|nr:unnamed protein product [Notodromas monacha]CAG0920116.1 unnamed protein product [Notodromas monacha]